MHLITHINSSWPSLSSFFQQQCPNPGAKRKNRTRPDPPDQVKGGKYIFQHKNERSPCNPLIFFCVMCYLGSQCCRFRRQLGGDVCGASSRGCSGVANRKRSLRARLREGRHGSDDLHQEDERDWPITDEKEKTVHLTKHTVRSALSECLMCQPDLYSLLFREQSTSGCTNLGTRGRMRRYKGSEKKRRANGAAGGHEVRGIVFHLSCPAPGCLRGKPDHRHSTRVAFRVELLIHLNINHCDVKHRTINSTIVQHPTRMGSTSPT